ncbi:class I SAM-dependent methyltransferase [Myxococcota bacterium]|nr:class I SAM-dependent methyltransferase [Myxococcota bacterium]MBU1536447.1 class I SAM-dependent methyltransferase [Myxococcota bacterium]
MGQLFKIEELTPLGINLQQGDITNVFIPPLDVYLDPSKLESRVIMPNVNNMLAFGIHRAVKTEEIELADDALLEEESDEEGDEVEEIEVESVESGSKPPPTPPAAATKPPPTPPTPPKAQRDASWSDDFFDDDYLLSLTPASTKITEHEVSFLEEKLAIPADGTVLDVGCGDGRHAIALGSKGYKVVAVERSVPFLLQASQVAKEMGVSVTFVKKDLRDYAPQETFDAVYSIGGTFGYYDDEENLYFIKKLAELVKPGGKVVLQGINRDFAVAVLPSRIWWEGNGCMIMDESYFDHDQGMVKIRRNAAFVTGKQRNYEILVRAYTHKELSKMVEEAGFTVLTCAGSFITPNEFMGASSPSLLMVLEKND